MAVHVVPRLAEAPSPEDFAEKYLRAAQPVVMPAHACGARAWTLASLRASIGTTVVHTRTNTACEDYKVVAKRMLFFLFSSVCAFLRSLSSGTRV